MKKLKNKLRVIAKIWNGVSNLCFFDHLVEIVQIKKSYDIIPYGKIK